ncbi:MAG TPA: ABC transporter permease [Candidatus Saccharimonadia bacterium]|nr:ABC transporter permease [Candidatus Saccharimonadia bacterium]
MSSDRTWPLFRLSTTGIFVRGSCWLLLLAGVLFAWLAPLVTPWEEKPIILQPARAQAAWAFAWLALFTWLPFQAAALGNRFRKQGLLEHFEAGGQKRINLCLQLNASVFVWLVAMTVLAMLVCLAFCLPSSAADASGWFWLVLQYGALYLLAAAPLIVLGVALGTRTHEIIAFLVPVSLLFLGLFGGLWLAPYLSEGDSVLGKLFWVLLPHYHLADLTPRLVFKMGPLPTADFLKTAGVLALEGSAFALTGLCTFRTRS